MNGIGDTRDTEESTRFDYLCVLSKCLLVACVVLDKQKVRKDHQDDDIFLTVLSLLTLLYSIHREKYSDTLLSMIFIMVDLLV